MLTKLKQNLPKVTKRFIIHLYIMNKLFYSCHEYSMKVKLILWISPNRPSDIDPVTTITLHSLTKSKGPIYNG